MRVPWLLSRCACCGAALFGPSTPSPPGHSGASNGEGGIAMSRTTRMGGAVIALALASAATPALAQIPGMPLFTNPRYGTGFRIHADFGKPTEDAPDSSDLSVYQAGVSFALGPLGIGANIGQSKTNFDRNQICRTDPNADCLEERVTASALVQLRVAGGGRSNLSLSAFGGASVDVSVDTA